MVKRETNTVSVAEMYSFHRHNRFIYSRELEWSKEKQENFIDSISNHFSIGSIILIPKIDLSGITSYRVIDGAQRLKTLFSYLDQAENVERSFWQYTVIQEYMDVDDEELIKKIRGRVS